ncbi:RNA-directed DNA polymerase, eukaryota, reverse transcriptase zinc-binding domain protein [Tanacetum coccineum]
MSPILFEDLVVTSGGRSSGGLQSNSTVAHRRMDCPWRHTISLPPSQSTNVNVEETFLGQEDIRDLVRDALGINSLPSDNTQLGDTAIEGDTEESMKMVIMVTRVFHIRGRVNNHATFAKLRDIRAMKLYKCEKTAKDMRWHDTGRTKDGKLRHLADGLAWSTFNDRYSQFASDPQSVRLGLASDGFNPFELQLLWKGVDAYDAFSKQHFKLKVSLMWTINDFPAYANLSGWSTKGRVACPVCANSTHSRWLKHGKKNCYIGHRRWLEPNHSCRFQKERFDGTIENRGPPTPLTGSNVLKQLSGIRFKYGKSKKRTREEDVGLTSTHAKEATHDNEGAFECTNTIIKEDIDGLDGKTKENTRKDLKEMGIRHDFHLINRPNGKPYLPPACYTMSPIEKSNFLQLLKDLKVPDGYSSNILRGVSVKDHKISNLKSHDGHILMQDVLPIALRASVISRTQSRLVKAVSDYFFFFKGLCAKVLDPSELDKMEYELVRRLCELEQIFPPSFFTVMVYLTIHLIYEAKLGGPVHYRWMYPVERYLMQLKSYVRNKAQPEGSIAEGYIKEKCLNFCSRYFEGVETPFNHPLRNDENVVGKELYMFNLSGRKLGKVEILDLDGKSLAQAHRYVLLNHSKIQPFRDVFLTEKQALKIRPIDSKTIEKLMVDEFPDRILNFQDVQIEDNDAET